MEVDFTQLQENLLEAYNDFITVLNDNNRNGTIEIEDYEIKREASDLLKAVKWILALQDPDKSETEDSMLSKAELVILECQA